MNSRIIYISLLLVHLIFVHLVNAQTDIVGRVVDSDTYTSLEGAIISKGKLVLKTDRNGLFYMAAIEGDSLLISNLGYESAWVVIVDRPADTLTILLQPTMMQIEEVVINSGYQLFKQREVTGAASFISQADIERNPHMNVLDRLRDMASGLVFNKNTSVGAQNRSISIRGQSTLFANTEPLIVLDNFPYEGDISQINPNDIENITILKDAAAAAIWGARAGNGVIVITTKTGKSDSKTHIDFGTNIRWMSRPDLKYFSQMSSADYIDVERGLFDQGYYKNIETSLNNAPLTPVVELLIARRDGKITADRLQEELDQLEQVDVRDDIGKYMYRNESAQQYFLSINAGGKQHSTVMSLGYDKVRESLVHNQYDRLTLSLTNTFRVGQDRLNIQPYLFFASNAGAFPNLGMSTLKFGTANIYPYAKLVDETGNPRPLTGNYRTSFVNQASERGFLNWDYIPLDELRLIHNNQGKYMFRTGVQADLRIDNHFSTGINYRFIKNITKDETLYPQSSFYARDMINNFTSAGPDNIVYNIPVGGIMDRRESFSDAHNARVQLRYENNWRHHVIRSMVGAEISNVHSLDNLYRLYGFDPIHETSQPVDYSNFYNMASNPNQSRQVPYVNKGEDLTDRYISYFGTLGYTFREKYLFNSSIRLDRSNIFGVESNQKGVPLYSVSAGWNVGEEEFVKGLTEGISLLKFRLSYGYTGNIDNNLSAYTTARRNPTVSTMSGLPYAYIVNPPNPELRWERIQISNIGLDLGVFQNNLLLSVDAYRKIGKDLIGNAPIPTSSGISMFYGNTASTKTLGVDMTINGNIPVRSDLEFRSILLLSYNKDEVLDYKVQSTVLSVLAGGYAGNYPIKGKPLHAVYAFPWIGLDPKDGRPIGRLHDEETRDYAKIVQTSTLDDLMYFGSSRPRIFGSFRQEINFRNVLLSIGLAYRFGYWYRRPSVNYNTVLSGIGGHGDFAQRWQKPGDENRTHVPSLPALRDNNEVNFYQYAAVLVEPGDHLRLQDVKLQYRINREQSFIRQVSFFCFIDNLGLLWKKSNVNLDPDYLLMKPNRNYSIGLKLEF